MTNEIAMPGRVVANKISPRPKLLSFDVFGTLIDVRAGSRAAFARILTGLGGEAGQLGPLELWEQWEKANIQRYWDRPYHSYRDICRASLQEVFHKLRVKGDPDSIQLYFDAFTQFQRFPDVDEVLDALRAAGYKLAVVSNIDDDLLQATPLGRTFDLVCTSERARGYKPDGTLFKYLVAGSGLHINEIFHCGQSQHTDLVGGRPLGLTVAWINRRGLARAEGVPKPSFEFQHLPPILDLLL
jgi:2-haloalkanoic acid dehalogenase type II